VWAKKSAMPESVTDRPTCAHEKIFLLSKSRTYFYDVEAVREPLAPDSLPRVQRGHHRPGHKWENGPGNQTIANDLTNAVNPSGRNMRNVWHLGPEPQREQHYASYPTEIPRRAISAGSSERGACPECLAPWRRLTEKSYVNPGARTTNGPRSLAQRHETAGFQVRLEKQVATLGWEPTCKHGHEPIRCTVLDPFLGSGTTLLVADQLGRDGVGIELNPEYVSIAQRRIVGDAPMLVDLNVA
jgi:site-specific DNA-methyltransferase (adenine-specific)